jgi:hypothetical protein
MSQLFCRMARNSAPPGHDWLVGDAIARELIAVRPGGANTAERLCLDGAIYQSGFIFGNDTRASAAEYPVVTVLCHSFGSFRD